MNMLTQNIFNQLLLFMNLYQHVKNQAISPFYSRDIVDLKTLQTDWPRAFWPISEKLGFFKILDLCRNITDNINFPYRTNSEKINDQIIS